MSKRIITDWALDNLLGKKRNRPDVQGIIAGLKVVPEDPNLDKAIDELISVAWHWGHDCEVDDIHSMKETGDSHNEGQRRYTTEKKEILIAYIQGLLNK